MPLAQAYLKNVSMHVLVVVSCVAVNQDCLAIEPPWSGIRVGTALSVTLSQGRTVHGTLDARTTNDHLHLALENAGMRVSSILSTSNVKNIQLEESRPQAALLQDNSSLSVVAAHTPQILEDTKSRSVGVANSLAVFAQVDNWNGDPKSDGIRLLLRPTGANGEMIHATGSVSVQLNVYRGDWRNRAGRLHEEESWSYELSKSDYNHQGATITLPFRRIHPDTDHAIYALGTINVRLNIAGQGVLDATLDDVELRKHSMTSELRKRR